MADANIKLSTTLADFLVANDYHLDVKATRELNAIPNSIGAERKIYSNGSAYVCAQTDNKTYVALNKASQEPGNEFKNQRPTWFIDSMHGGRVPNAQDKTTEDLHARLKLIATDNGIPLAAAKGPEKARA